MRGGEFAHLPVVILAVVGTACCTLRPVPEKVDLFRGEFNGKPAVVMRLDEIRNVTQLKPDLCWAASLEQALAHQGVAIDQYGISEFVFPDARSEADRTIDMVTAHFKLRFLQFKGHDGSEVWAHVETDGGPTAPMIHWVVLNRKLFYELQHRRITIAAIRNENGTGHMVTVIGGVFASQKTDKPVDVDQFTRDDLRGFLIYDPLTAREYLVSSATLFDKLDGLIYVTTYATEGACLRSMGCSAKLH